jgi:hypothetical protein
MSDKDLQRVTESLSDIGQRLAFRRFLPMRRHHMALQDPQRQQQDRNQAQRELINRNSGDSSTFSGRPGLSGGSNPCQGEKTIMTES